MIPKDLIEKLRELKEEADDALEDAFSDIWDLFE